jgi:hypothetical protein
MRRRIVLAQILDTKSWRKVWAQSLGAKLGKPKREAGSLSGQAFTALGAACVNHSAAATCFHANQKTVCTGAACFRRLVSAFHFESSQVSDPPNHMVIFGGNPRLSQTFRGLANQHRDFS